MTDLLSKLEEAIAETERIAIAASGPKRKIWWPEWETSEYFGYETPHVLIGLGSKRQPLVGGHFTYTPVEKQFADHIVLNDPARVLRRVARDRKLLELHRPLFADRQFVECTSCISSDWPCPTFKAVAEDYEIQVED